MGYIKQCAKPDTPKQKSQENKCAKFHYFLENRKVKKRVKKRERRNAYRGKKEKKPELRKARRSKRNIRESRKESSFGLKTWGNSIMGSI